MRFKKYWVLKKLFGNPTLNLNVYKNMKRLTNVRSLGRYKNTKTGKEYNLKTGRNMQRSTDHIFYLYRGVRQFISDKDYYSLYKKIKE